MRYLAPIALTLALVSCSSSGGDESSFCEDRGELQSSFQVLRDVNIAEDGVEELDAAIDAVLADLDAVQASAAELEPDVDVLRTALQGTQSAVETANTPADKVIAAVDGLSNSAVAWESLEAAGATCD